jgi:hypothetical protein
MKWYQTYFFLLKFIVLAQIVLLALGYTVAKSPLFAIVDTVFKVSIGLFMGIYFWLFRPKGLDWEDGIIVSIGGFLILTDIQFGPLIDIYKARDQALKTTATTVSTTTGI